VSGAALRIEALHFSYGPRPVLQGLELELAAGERVALLGRNGAGKSTLLSLIAGVRRPAGGRLLLDGRDLLSLAPRERARQVALVPQSPTVPFAFTVREWVSLGRTPYLASFAAESAADSRAVEDALAEVGVAELAGRLVGEISGGERQRAALAQAFAQEPRLLLLDEATAHLDLRHQMALLERVSHRSRTQGLTVLAALHDVNLAALWFERLVLLHEGRVLADGRPEEVLRPELLLTAFGCRVSVVAHPAHGGPLVALLPMDEARDHPAGEE